MISILLDILIVILNIFAIVFNYNNLTIWQVINGFLCGLYFWKMTYDIQVSLKGRT